MTRRGSAIVILQLALAALVLGAAASAGWRLVRLAFSGTEPSALSGLAGAFWGAFFAFCFLICASFLTRVYARWMVNYYALVELQPILNDALNRIEDNRELLKHMQKQFSQAPSSSTAVILSNRFIPVPTQPDVLTRLVHADLANQLYQFFGDVRLLNDHMHAANLSHDNAQQACLGRIIDVPTYNSSLAEFSKGLPEIEERLTERREDVDRLFAIVRYCLRSKPLVSRVTVWLSRRHFTAADERGIAQTLKELEKEFAQNVGRRNRWQKRIRDLM